MMLEAHGLRIGLPRGWSGRMFTREGGIARLHAASFPLELSDGEFGDRTTAAMPAAAAFIALAEYAPGGDLEPGTGLFSSRRLPLPLDPLAFSANRLAHPRPGQAGMQHFFTVSARPFCLYVVLAGDRNQRHRWLSAVDHVLRSLRISRRQ
jgi:hypothetical protein